MSGEGTSAPWLGPDEVHAWSSRLDPPPADLAAFAQSLTEAERALAQRRVTERLRTRALASRAFLRAVLGRYLGCPPGEVVLVEGTHGKPMLAPGCAARVARGPGRLEDAADVPAAHELRFNLAHADDFALLAVARGREVGVDVEPTDRRVDLEPIAERFFAPAERAALFALPAAARPAGFLQLWTRKEAYLKARGDGLSADLAAFAVTLGPDPHLTPIGDALDADGWTIRHLDPIPGFVGALVARGRAPVSVRSFAWRS